MNNEQGLTMIAGSTKAAILQMHQKMQGEGALLTPQQLEGYYLTFRDQFGPDRLASLSGESLLETMHAHGNKSSLVYWLEFKDDEEFPSSRFGSISGGSAYKFGIFRSKETGTWVTADESNNPKEIAVSDAVVIATRHRDQLLAGVERIKQLGFQGTDEDYRKLQTDLERLAPDVSDLAWGHKYFHLTCPDKIDDLHTLDWQRYLLIKLLQRPPVGQGRYLCAGRFLALSRDVAIPVCSLTRVLTAIYGSRHRYWRLGTSDGETPRNRWELMRNGSCVAIGWQALGDLSWLDNSKESREKLHAAILEKQRTTPQQSGRIRTQVTNFVQGIRKGDIVLACDGGTVLGIGRIAGAYSYEPQSDTPHRRPIEWLNLDEWMLPSPEGLRTTVHEIRKYPENTLEAEKRIQGSERSTVSNARHHLDRALTLPPTIARIREVLERKGQVILYGPPGTGKTHWAEAGACELAALHAFGKAFSDLNDLEKKQIVGDTNGAGAVRLCCFHPAYGYEDFIEGYRPETLDGRMTFTLRDGIFKGLCKDAAHQPGSQFYLIVDEINRGDIPRIFGELLTVLEKNKRNKRITLPLSNESFLVPENVYLIGTMNTADRSISLLDAALRRRFGFIELMPDSKVLGDQAIQEIPLGQWLDALNRQICQHVGGDARNLQIGHSYFLENGRPIRDVASLKRVVRDDLIPLLEEYCYEDFSALQGILGNALVNQVKQEVRQELFEDGRDDDLIQALKEPYPDIFTSREAIAAGLAEAVDESDSDEAADEDR